ncbi:MAG TPA: AI-2E family transporter [Candidatus Acidoferrum sp.]|nr:AI-2E family transporter [Candidatus Acidoferrum sp.]
MTQATGNTTTSDRLTTVLSYGALLLLGYLVFRIVEPFAKPLAWSAIFAIFFYPAYTKLLKKTSKGRAAAYCTLGVTVLLIVPALLVLWYAAREAVGASAEVQAALSKGAVGLPTHLADWIRHRLPEAWRGMDVVGPLRQGAEKIGSYLASSVGSWVRDLFSFFLHLFILLFALFFMFRDGEQFVHALQHLIPFDPEIQKDMLQESHDLIFASVAAAVSIAAIQGVLGGTAFALTGLGAPVFMGVVIALSSIVPVVGSALIWVPAALWLGINGHWGKALLMVAICGVVAGVLDNLVRPLFMRNRSRLNELMLFISILGGLEVFGMLGLVIGPTIMAAALGVFRVYMEHRDQMEKETA